MTVEIREVVIRTEVKTHEETSSISQQDINQIKKRVVQECMGQIKKKMASGFRRR